ncbi:MAG: hypothetical protein H0V19_05580, partial [Euzebyales bacterium]|nr:hypothetical protein [Euzebyales bacterium]MBA3622484.1 hypothetical protein [Euzebyales bacterium]
MARSAQLPAGRRPMAAGHAILVILVAFGVGSLLNAPALVESAGRQPFGWRRSV